MSFKLTQWRSSPKRLTSKVILQSDSPISLSATGASNAPANAYRWQTFGFTLGYKFESDATYNWAVTLDRAEAARLRDYLADKLAERA